MAVSGVSSPPTMWKGTPQDFMDHVRGAHDVPWDIKSANLEKFVPPWTVQRQSLDGFSQALSFGGYLLTCYCSVRLIYRWFIIIVFTGVGYRISLSGRIILLICESLCHRQQPCLSVIWCPRFSPVQFRCAMFVPLSRNWSRRGRPDVPVAGCGPYEYLRSQSVSNLRL